MTDEYKVLYRKAQLDVAKYVLSKDPMELAYDLYLDKVNYFQNQLDDAEDFMREMVDAKLLANGMIGISKNIVEREEK